MKLQASEIDLAVFLNNDGHHLYGPMFDLAGQDRSMAIQSTTAGGESALGKLTESDQKWLGERMPTARAEMGLDFGSGMGRLLKFLSTRCQNLISADSSKTMLDWAAKNSQMQGVRFTHLDGLNLPFEANSLDFIVCWRVLQHVARIHAAWILIQFFNILKPGGKLYFAVPNAKIPNAEEFFTQVRKGNLRTLMPADERLFSEEEVREYLHRAGFKIERMDLLPEIRVVAVKDDSSR